ncbi:MAG: hypothetical protein HYR56_12820 [Acidobacteria bacterium]|nr:hypothetical protein [Acidobacteriota bacterium]MBI3424248.1 hypothetical protein [Acidobacteriota bacterium]
MFGEDEPPPDEWQFGLMITFALHGLQFVLGPVTGGYSFFFIGISQLLYILPAIVLCKSNNRDDYVKGLIIGASITFLLNATCTAYVMSHWP